MRKIWIPAVLSVMLLTGCGTKSNMHSAYHTEALDVSSKEVAAESIDTGDTTIATTTSSLDANISRSIVTPRENTTILAVQSQPITSIASASTSNQLINTTTATSQLKKTEVLNITSKNSFGTLTFSSAVINNADKSVQLYFSSNSTQELNPDMAHTNGIDKNGNTLRLFNFLGNSKQGVISFYGFNDSANLSTITVTYAFENVDPVTVAINIPGV